jgi:hypothetical protein
VVLVVGGFAQWTIVSLGFNDRKIANVVIVVHYRVDITLLIVDTSTYVIDTFWEIGIV